uniref:Uncharacterized protein n=1 Tax=Onchocerca volvulus TaxID=6282 RepID=A0A8R1TRB8_ONCVO
MLKPQKLLRKTQFSFLWQSNSQSFVFVVYLIVKDNADRLHVIGVGDDNNCKISDYKLEITIVMRKLGIRPTVMKHNQECYLELCCPHLQQFCR